MPSGVKRRGRPTDNSLEGSQHKNKKTRFEKEQETLASDDDDDDDDLIDDEEEDDDDDDLDLDQAEDKSQRKQRHGKPIEVNEAGTIARVEVVNFMCHKYLKIDFGPKINFVIGHNGSGKSAILTALTIALGAKATSTNRGKNLSSLIREGANAALASVHITNKGPDAYKQDVYGDVIIVERKINRDGVGTYKLKSASNRVISTKREELTTICDHYSIQIDNPLTTLTQDMARQFLSSSTAEEKYRLFLRGTQLAQLHEDYLSVTDAIHTTKAIIDRKKQYLPDLQKRAKESEAKYKQMLEAREIDSRIDEYNNELVWSQIIAKENEVERARANAAEARKLVQIAEEKVQVVDTRVARHSQDMADIQKMIDEFHTAQQPNRGEKQRLKQIHLEQENRNRELKSDMREINDQVKGARERIAKNNEKIAEEKAKQASSYQEGKRAQLEEEIRTLTIERDEARERQQSNSDQTEQCNTKRRELAGQLQELDQKLRRLKNEEHKTNQYIESLKAQRENKMAAYGRNMPQLLEAIQKETRWRGRRPVGPIGSYLSAKHPQYVDVLEVILKRSMANFVVETFDDSRLLNAMLKRFNLSYSSTVVVAKYDLFDYSHGEPSEEYLTVLRCLEFDNEWVKRQLIVANDIEKTLLMEDRAAADQVMARKPRNIKACYTASIQKVGAAMGARTEALEPYRGPPRFRQDVEPQIREAVGKLRELEQEMRQVQGEKQRLENEMREWKRKEDSLARQAPEIDRVIRDRSFQIRFKEGKLREEDVSIGTDEYERANEVEKERIEQLRSQFKHLSDEQHELAVQLQETVNKINELNQQDQLENQKLVDYQQEIQKITTLRDQEITKLNALRSKHAAERQRYETAKSNAEHLANTCASWTEQAMQEYPDRVETRATPEAIQRKIRELEILREETEKNVGASLEEVEQEARDTLEAWSEAKTIIQQMDSLHKQMQNSLVKRIAHWQEFRTFIALAAMGHFSYYMHKRGDNGSLKFNHKKEKLEIRVATGDQFSRGTRHKDSKSLSGGEKSFSQVSLLLALWQGISSPVVCLDEFDVYMDAVNRKQSMKMLMDAANENSSQYILITPQDASNMVPGPYVTVHRLADPDRS